MQLSICLIRKDVDQLNATEKDGRQRITCITIIEPAGRNLRYLYMSHGHLYPVVPSDPPNSP